MKIAIYSREIPSTTFIENLIEGLSESGIEIYLFGYKKKKKTYLNKNIHVYTYSRNPYINFFRIFAYSLILIFKSPVSLLKAWSRISMNLSVFNFFYVFPSALLILCHKPDIFHYQWTGHLEFEGLLIEIINCKYVVSFRGAHINYSPLKNKKLRNAYIKYFPKISAFHSVSKAIAAESSKFGASEKNNQVIYTSVNDVTLAFPFKQYKEKQSTAVKIISVGRFHWKKGYNYAIDAMHHLIQSGYKITYTIIASGDIPEEFQYQILDTGMGNHIELVQGKPHNEILDLISTHDIFLLPSVEEGIANVAIEAMCVGTFVISSNCGGMTELVTHNKNGLIFKSRDVMDMAQKIIDYTQLPDSQIQEMRACAHDIVISYYNRKRMINEFIEFYNNI